MRERRPGRWELRVYVGTDPATRRRLYRTRTVHGNRGDAERELGAFSAAVVDRSATGSAVTVGELLERWFSVSEPGWSPATVRQTRSVLRCQLLPHLGRVRVGDLTAERIDELYVELAMSGGQRGQGLAPGTVKRVHVDVARASDPALHLLLVLAATTGARRAQLLGLRRRDVDLDHQRVSFCGGWVEGEHGPVLTTTKNKHRYAVEIDGTTASLLAAHLAAFAGASPGPESFIFAKDAGGQVITGHDGFAAERLAKALHGTPVVGERPTLGPSGPTGAAAGAPAGMVALIASGVSCPHERCVEDLAGTEPS